VAQALIIFRLFAAVVAEAVHRPLERLQVAQRERVETELHR
jgi:hypothetical protein